MKQTTKISLRLTTAVLSGTLAFGVVLVSNLENTRERRIRAEFFSGAPELKPEWKKQRLLEVDKGLFQCGKLAATSLIPESACLVAAQVERADVEAAHKLAGEKSVNASADVNQKDIFTFVYAFALGIWMVFASAKLLFRKNDDTHAQLRGVGLPNTEGAST